MIYISHRGNLNGKNPHKENSPEYIMDALKGGYEVEVDIWYINEFYLGHDKPTYKLDFNFFIDYLDKIWFHCKNIEALEKMRNSSLIYFWHDVDSHTMVMNRNDYIWTFPGINISKGCICVLPEMTAHSKDKLSSCSGLCSDYIENYKFLI